MVLPLGDLEKTRIVPLATYSLIALNVVIFLIQLDRGPTFTTAYAATLTRSAITRISPGRSYSPCLATRTR